ncbi:glycosyltransferase [Rhodosalinus sediminis]|uniref:glycosyltransferase n=1 Tax=Rhodosalinus sediminis TaxID=1940533 RepID=UPI002353D1A2|nr:glycosyltransferase [Rhodosalinus sediminis]
MRITPDPQMPRDAARAGASPAVSVIVPVHDVAAHIGPCLQSLREQTFTDFEVIVVDDGSTDGSDRAARAAVARDPRFRLIRQDNRGLSEARNAGLDAATGAVIAFVDGDDRVMPDFLARMHGALVAHDADWVACALRYCFGDGSGTAHSAIHDAEDLAAHPAARLYRFDDWCDVIRHFPSAWNKLYRRSLIDGLRFDPGTWFEDHAFFLRAAARTDHILHLPEPLYLQTRGRPGQITTSDDERVFDQFPVLDTVRAILEAGPHGAADTAFARLAARLTSERSTALRDPERLARFARTAAQTLRAAGVDHRAGQDAGGAQARELEVAGETPLSVVLPWDGRDTDALAATLATLAGQPGPAHEVIVVCPPAAAPSARSLGPAQVIATRARGPGRARQAGLAAARGRYVLFLAAGDRVVPGALADWTEAALRAGADIAVAQFRMGTTDVAPVHNGFADMRPLRDGQPPEGPLDLAPEVALALAPDLGNRLIRRAFAEAEGLRFTRGPRSGWAVALGAALLAERGAYLDRPAVALARYDPGRRAGGRLGAGHAALLAALPARAAARLPRGWQRRLYARALRDEVDTALPAARPARALRLGAAAAGALRRGYGDAGHTPAGLDPSVGPRLARLLDPLSLLRAARHSSPGVAPVAPQAQRHIFPLHDDGFARFRIAFHAHPCANIFFTDARGALCPFHLSFRADEQRLVVNDTRADGRWRAERPTPFPLRREGHAVTVHFDLPRVHVAIDGARVCTLGPRTLRHRGGLHALDRITHLSLEGGARALDLVPRTPGRALTLDPRLMLRAARPPDGATLTCDARDAALPVTEAALPDGTPALVAAPVGRLWTPGQDAVTVRLGRETRLTLTREDMAARIAGLLQAGLDTGDMPLLTVAIEQVAAARLMPLLPAAERDRIRALARRVGLSGSLERGEDDDAPRAGDGAAEALRRVDPARAAIDAAVARFTQSQRSDPPADPAQVLAGLALPPAERRGLFLALSEHFCTGSADFGVLFDAARAEGLHRFDPAEADVWARSAMLPFLLFSGDHAAVDRTLWSLADPDEGWALTACIARTVRQAQTRDDVPAWLREGAAYAFFEIARRQSKDYWGRAPCAEFVAVAAWLVAHTRRDDYMRCDLVRGCIEVYGLSRAFWTALDAETGGVPPPELVPARQHFESIRADWSSDAARHAALRWFEAHGTADAARMRRELLGPAGLPCEHGRPPTRRALEGDSPTPATSAIRHMAFPGSAPVAADVVTLAAEGMADLYPDIPRARHLGHQMRVAERLERLVRDPDAEPADQILAELAPLVDARDGYLGIGLALTLAAAWPPDGPAADRAADWALARIAGLPDASRAGLAAAPALQAPLARLTARDDAVARRVRDALGDILPPAPSARDPLDTGVPDAPLYDTVVTVFSCRANLETRIPALRAGWLSLLEDLGVPYLVMVGDGDGTRRGDTVFLEAPDDYEGLPQKTLAAIDWVVRRTRHAHMLKIDDDCFLNAPLFFRSLSFRKHDYYGRRLHRAPGQMDRAWHQAKSRSARGRLDLDRSPEPSTYADGGSGYTLSRAAMRAACAAADSADGRRLIADSFMEDKLLGDLLALKGVQVADEDYRISIRRRAHRDATPVAAWVNGFLPSRAAPVTLAHLDRTTDQAEAMRQLSAPTLAPRKIWPSFQDVRLGSQSNALDLVSPEARVERAREAEVAVVACMRNEMFMLETFLEHYRRLGVGAFLVADNGSDDGTLDMLAEQEDVALFSVDTDYNRSAFGVAWQQALLSAFRPGRWSLVADADELLVWQRRQTETLPELLRAPEFATAEAVRIFMLDMYPEGRLSDVTLQSGDPFAEAGYADREPFLTHSPMRGPFSDQPAWTSALRHRLIPGASPNDFTAQKLALLRYHPFMRLSAGLHFVADARIAARELIFGHFKYTADFRRKAEAEVARGQHWGDAREYRKYLALVSEGRERIFDPDVSVPWTEAPFVAARLDRAGPSPPRGATSADPAATPPGAERAPLHQEL